MWQQWMTSCRYRSRASGNRWSQWKTMWSLCPWHCCWCQRIGQSTCVFTQSSLYTEWGKKYVFTQNGANKNKQRVSVRRMAARLVQVHCGSSNDHSLQLWWAEKYLKMPNTLKLAADWWQQQKTTWGSIFANQEQESDGSDSFASLPGVASPEIFIVLFIKHILFL